MSSEDQSYSKSILGADLSPTTTGQNILDVYWDYVHDQLQFNLNVLTLFLNTTAPTKREVVGVTARFFDPLGIVSPDIVRFKMLFQGMCRLKLDWDEPLQGKQLKQWSSLVNELKDPGPIVLPRCYFTHVSSVGASLRLVGFCDASTRAYAAVVYLEINAVSDHQRRFIAAKTHVAPLSSQTVPRLELFPALLLARLARPIYEALKFDLTLNDTICFTDSKVTLFWIKGTD